MKFTMPTNLIEAVSEISKFYDFYDAVRKHKTADDFSTTYHHSVGREIRNQFALWKGAGACPVDEAPLYYWFHRRGLRHPDDMSTIILELAWCEYHSVAFKLEDEIAKYQAYWENHWKEQWNSINRAVARVLEKY